ncbi:MAG: helicase-associated domain-containing protein [Sphaerochaeta sp.]|uniref:DNA repair helicase XPB n=1 Tax=Sphaerochaeta sp. TaxID=1972642 RepID=UPI001D4606F7|nr:DNA repair helicase XPB [uncultured Sphaerochaeta sp.]MDD3056728.1 helicase-associated domain-containing protein [Sphaerochaeta sp.]MDD3928296.1 helicase-associated domain-containing protein [Sphaerochaeta sp.]NCC12117.1 DEAD/DEAH box helicase [Spirochaetia bacterium]NCC88816.1 DEAD/DEAH box helicase [Spirochaetia bacterium]
MQDTPLIVQSDKTLLLDVHHQRTEECRADLVRFCELIKSPEHMHTYTLSAISLWNAAASGIKLETILDRLTYWSKFPVAESVLFYVRDMASRWGKVRLTESDDPRYYRLEVDSERIKSELMQRKALSKVLVLKDSRTFLLETYARGEVKLQLIKIGYPVDDRIRLNAGPPLPLSLREQTRKGKDFVVRPYQKMAADALLGDLGPGCGFGTIVLPCGSGKTVVGMEIMQRLATKTLVVTTNVAAVHQWMQEILDKTDLTEEQVGEYTGERKDPRDVTVCTYQVLTYRPDKEGPFPHLDLLTKGNWGLIIYDEVHMLPAPVFKITAELQAVYRVGLTATLVREDGREDEVFSLVGPKRFDVPWNELQQQGFIAEAYCHEIRIDLPKELEIPYALGTKREKYRMASENPLKLEVVKELVNRHPDDFILIIGQYLDQLKHIADAFKLPIITGSTPNAKREELYSAFREGTTRILVVSKVANFAIDLPDASVAIQVSGTFGSRSEEAQRLGRVLRPKNRSSFFYSVVTRYSNEEEFAANRQKFLAEQGYSYEIEVWDN